MQGSVFNQGPGPGAFKSAFASNIPSQGFNDAFNQAFGPARSTPAYGRNDVSTHISPFKKANEHDAATAVPSGNYPAFANNAFDNAIGAFGQPLNQHVAANAFQPAPFNQPVVQQHISPFGQPSSHASPFGKSVNNAPTNVSPFSTPSQQPSPFQPANNSSPFKQPGQTNIHNSPFQQPGHANNKSMSFQQPSASNVSPFQPPGNPNSHISSFKQPNTLDHNASPFNKPSSSNNKASPFSQPKTKSPFGQPLRNSASPFQQIQTFTKTSGPETPKSIFQTNTNVPKTESKLTNRVSPFTQPKRGASNLRGKGRVPGDTPMLKRGGNTVATSTPFAKKRITKENLEVKEPSKTTAEDRAVRFGSTSKSILYDQFKERRVRERQQAIENGLIPDPNNPTRLEDAIDFRGTCQTKCPEFEMLEREIQNGLDSLEMDDEGNLDPEKAVKAYRRSAAGIDQPLPSDVRSPEALLYTLDYLIDQVLSKNSLEKCHAFVRDRTRSIRQDFTLQNIRDINAVQAHERIARFHILCLHEMCEMDEGKFSKQQETEQLRKVLVSLMEFYDDLREEGIETENEAEFRAYNIISLIRDQDVARQAMTLPIYLFKSQPITRALEFRALSQRNNEIMESSSRRNKPENIEASQNFYSAFFKLIADPNTSFLMACMLETHFPEVRKGALKAMNVSYMLKAGGVQAEDVRQVLAYDSVKQLFQEAVLYGIIINNSLGEPTLCFGQKHYNTKIAVFLEPLSNPSQKKSLLLVEPKKAGRSFTDIINGINPDVAPMANQNVFARQPNPFSNESPIARSPQVQLNVKLSQLTGEEEKKRENELLETARVKAEAATAQAARERKKLEALQEKKRLELELKEAQRLEAERRLKREQQLLEEMQMKEERIKLLERQREQEIYRKKVLQKQKKEKEMAAMHLNVIKSQLTKRLLEQILGLEIEKQSRMAATKAVKTRQVLKRAALPWLARARASIQKRQDKALLRKKKWRFNMFFVTHNPYISSDDTIYKYKPLHSTTEGIKERVNQSLQAEEMTLETIDPTVAQASIWEPEEFPLHIYPRVRDKVIDLKRSQEANGDSTKPAWQLLINVSNSDIESSVWFKRKFGLDNVSLRKDGLYQAFDVNVRMNTPERVISCRSADETGAVIFSLPESTPSKTPAEAALYWEENRKRLDKLTHDMHYYNPGMQIPFLFTYFPDFSSTELTLQKIPTLLGLDSNRLISDYHILVMNPLTVCKRMREEVNWLSNNSQNYEIWK